MLGSVVYALSADRARRGRIGPAVCGNGAFLTLNVEQNPLTAAQFDIRSIPTLLIFRDGRLVDRIIGMYPKPLIEERIWAASGG